MITGFDHTSFTVTDVDRAVRFWTEALGFELGELVVRDGDWPARVTGVPEARLKIAHLFGHGQHVEFIQYLAGGGDPPDWQPNLPGAGHVALEVTDIDDTCGALLAAGATRQGELADVVIDSVLVGRSIYLRDPNGIIIELWETIRSPETR